MNKMKRLLKALLYVLICLIACIIMSIIIHIIGTVWPTGLFIILALELIYLSYKFYKNGDE